MPDLPPPDLGASAHRTPPTDTTGPETARPPVAGRLPAAIGELEGLPTRLQDMPGELWLAFANYLPAAGRQALLDNHPGFACEKRGAQAVLRTALHTTVGALRDELDAARELPAPQFCRVLLAVIERAGALLLRSPETRREPGLQRQMAQCMLEIDALPPQARQRLACAFLQHLPRSFFARSRFDGALYSRFAARLLDTVLGAAEAGSVRAWRALAQAGEKLPGLINLEAGLVRGYVVLGPQRERARRIVDLLSRPRIPADMASHALGALALLLGRYFFRTADEHGPGLLRLLDRASDPAAWPAVQEVMHLVRDLIDPAFRLALIEAVLSCVARGLDADPSVHRKGTLDMVAARLRYACRDQNDAELRALERLLARHGCRQAAP